MGFGSGFAVGIAIGVALGIALDNLALGLAIGVAIGAGLGTTARKRSGDPADASRGGDAANPQKDPISDQDDA